MSIPGRIKGLIVGRAAVLSGVWRHPLNRGSRLRAIGDYCLWNAVKFTMDAPHVLKLTDDIEIILGRKENYGSAVYAHNLPDYPEMVFLAHFLRSSDAFLDVGANVGMYAVWVAGVTGATVTAFEPVPATHVKLIKNIRLNDLEALVTPHRLAVGEARGSVVITANEGGLDHVVSSSSASSEKTVEVPVAALDDFSLDTLPAAMKVDVEGFEMQALKGASRLLAQPTLKAIVIELQDWTLRNFGTTESEVRDFLGSHGFEPHVYDPETRQLTPAREKTALNAIFVRDAELVREKLRSASVVKFPARPNGV
jgi:FkbM family methyltransferase